MPMRLVSTSPDNTEILCALGFEASLVGISRHCDYPPELQDRIAVVSDFAKADVAIVEALKPDLVFCSTYYQAPMVEALVSAHCRVFVSQPSSIASIYDNIRYIANLLGVPERGYTLIDQMRQGMPIRPKTGIRVFAEEWGDPIVHAAPWIQEMVMLAGGEPVLADRMSQTHTNGRIVSAEEVVQARADMVLLSWCGVHGRIPLDKVRQRAGWDQLPALQKGQLFPVDDTFFVRPGPRLVEGYQMLVKLLETCS